ncbi:MAG TPA: hypothetical protein VIL99_06045 [Ignavibacteria bacterium]
MKKAILIPLILLTLCLKAFGIPGDTTFTAVLNEGEKAVRISAILNEFSVTINNSGKPLNTISQTFTLTVDGKSFADTLPYIDYFGVEIIDIDKSDKSNEILVSAGGSPDFVYWIFKYSTDLTLLLKTDFYMDIKVDGSGSFIANEWSGFCYLKDVFTFSKDRNKLEKEPVDFYPIKYTFDEDGKEKDYVVTVVKPFKLLTERDSKSAVSAETKAGEKIILTGYNGTYIKKYDIQEQAEVDWVWVQMKTQDGKTGWILMKAFDQLYWNEFLEGVVFAG